MKQILCYGDSNTWGYMGSDLKRYPWDIRWTGRVQERLGDKWRVIEEGLSAAPRRWKTGYSRTGADWNILFRALCHIILWR